MKWFTNEWVIWVAQAFLMAIVFSPVVFLLAALVMSKFP